MKKLVCLFMLFALGCPVLAVELNWSEFCPPEYIEAIEVSASAPNPSSQYMLGLSLVGVPAAIARKNEYASASLNNYWVSRRKQFDREVSNCKEMTDSNSRAMCYMNIRQFEVSKTSQHQSDEIARQSLKMQKLQAIQQMDMNNNQYYRSPTFYSVNSNGFGGYNVIRQ